MKPISFSITTMLSSKDIQKARRMALRKRTATACKSCKSAKSKCNDFRPCARCIRNDDDKSCASSSEINPMRNAQENGSLRHIISGSFDPNFGVGQSCFGRSGAYLSLEEVMEQTNPFNSIKRQRISDLVASTSFMVDRRFAHQQAGLLLNRASMPLLVDLGLGTTVLSANEIQAAHSPVAKCYDRPIQRCTLYPPSPWYATTFTPPTTIPTAFSSSTFAVPSNLLAPPLSFGFGLAGSPSPSSAPDLARLQCELRLAGMLHH